MPTLDPTPPVITVRDLVTQYGSRVILNGISVDIEPGEIMVIMGGSGSGKSTLLRSLLGLKEYSAGSVKVLGREFHNTGKKDLLALRKQMGVAFQGGALLSSLSVGENVALPLRHHTRLDDSTIQVMTRMKLEMVNLAGFENLMPAELSGGMVKRAALARAVIMDPKLLFFDEPSAGLDPVTSVELDELILTLRDAMGVSVVVVTHELDSAFKIADRITFLGNGKVLLTGSVDDVRNSDIPAIQDLINRRPRNDVIDADDYLNRLTGHES